MWFHGPWGYGMMGGYGGYGAGFGLFFMALFLIIVVAFFVIVVRYLGAAHHPPPAPPGRTALDILNERYARGEIDREEYQKKRADLGF